MGIPCRRHTAAALAGALLLTGGAAATSPAAVQSGPAATTVVASGLNSPRGLAFDRSGHLFVGEGGLGGSNSTVGQCRQVPPPVGPYTGGRTSRISRIDANGRRTTVVGGLPSDKTGPGVGSDVSGVADVIFVNGKLFALIAGGGCSHGVPGFPNSVVRVKGQRARVVANLSRFLHRHPPAVPNKADFEPDGTWYSITRNDGRLFTIDPNRGQLVRINARSGRVRQVVDLSRLLGHIVPTAIVFHRGALFVSNLTPGPFPAGGAKLWRISPRGHVRLVATGLTTVLGLRFHRGKLYALETSGGGDTFGAPNSGRVVRVGRNGSLTTVVDGLDTPTAMTFRPGTDLLYISVAGYLRPPGAGKIVRARVH
jgi:hypothetical protein